MSAALTVQMDETVLGRIDTLAAERGMTRDVLVRIALEDLIAAADTPVPEFEDWQLALIDEGLAAADKGDVASIEEVDAIFSKYRV